MVNPLLSSYVTSQEHAMQLLAPYSLRHFSFSYSIFPYPTAYFFSYSPAGSSCPLNAGRVPQLSPWLSAPLSSLFPQVTSSNPLCLNTYEIYMTNLGLSCMPCIPSHPFHTSKLTVISNLVSPQ